MNTSSFNDPLYYEKLGTDFDKFISDYDVARRIRLIFNQLLKNLRLPSEARVLEIGCGTGRISIEINKRFPSQLTVNDISASLCQNVAKKLGCPYLAGDCQALPCTDASFDLIISSECIEHTHNPWMAMKEISRVLKPEGYLIVTTPNQLWYPALIASQALKIRKFQGMEHLTWPCQMHHWLKHHGFTDIFFSGCHLFPWQIPFAQKVLPFFDQGGHVLYPLMINYGFSAKKL